MPEGMTSVDKALVVLQLLCREPRLGVRQIGRRLGISAPTVHRLLATLASHGLVEQMPGGQGYRLGLACLDLGHAVLGDIDIVQAGTPVALALRDDTLETVTIQIPVDTDQVCVHEREGLHDIKHTVGIGRHMALYAGASGRAILAHLPTIQAAFYRRARLAQIAPNTVTDRAALARLLEQTRRAGHAVSHSESRPGVVAVAAPIFDRDGGIAGSISISGPEGRLTAAVVKDLVPKVMEAGRQVSRNLGSATGRSTAAGAAPIRSIVRRVSGAR